MSVGKFCHFTSTWRTFDETLLNEERFIDLFHRTRVFTNSSGNGAQTNRSALELVDDGGEYLVVNLVKTKLVNVQRFERHVSNWQVNGAVALHLCKVTHTPQQRIGNTGSATTTPCYLACCIEIAWNAQQLGRTENDFGQHIGIIIFKMQVNAETGTERCCQESATSGGTY